MAQKKTPAVTVSVVRELLRRLLDFQLLSLSRIVSELNATLRRKEESRIDAWLSETGSYPPRRELTAATTARVIVSEPAADPPLGATLPG